MLQDELHLSVTQRERERERERDGMIKLSCPKCMCQ